MSIIRLKKERQAKGLPTDAASMRIAMGVIEDAIGADDQAVDDAAPDAADAAPDTFRPAAEITPARAKALRLQAAAAFVTLAGRTDTGHVEITGDGATAEELFVARTRHQLDEHRRQLKAIQSVERKIELKREILPLYADWIQGVFAAPGGGPRGLHDEITVAVMVWCFDIGAFEEALPIAEYVLRYGLTLPGNFKSSVPVFLVDTVADAAIKAYRAGGETATAFPAGVLVAIEDLVVDEDMHDQCRAKLEKAIGAALLHGATDDDLVARQQQTLKRYVRALELDDGVGVKKDIEQLRSALKKSGASDTTVEQGFGDIAATAHTHATTDLIGPTTPEAVAAVLDPTTTTTLPPSPDAG